MNRRRLRFVVVLLLPFVTYAAWAGYVRLFGEHVQTNTFVGRSEQQIRSSCGEPTADRQGYQPLALHTPPSLPPGSIRTLIFHPGGLLYPEGGTLWVWLTLRDGEWTCFESCWFADGVVF